MSYSLQLCGDRWGYLMKSIIIALACLGVVFSVLASETCEFLYFKKNSITAGADSTTTTTTTFEMEPPFEDATEGWVGIFQYDIIQSNNQDDVTGGCTLYDDQFSNAPLEALIASQFCAAVAPSLALLAIALSIAELFCCTFHGSFLVTSLVFLAAAGVQGGTFSIVAEPSFCFDDSTGNNKCDVGPAVYFSASAAAAFFICCVLLCCSPRPIPCCQRRRRRKQIEDPSEEDAPVIMPPEITTGVSSNQEGMESARHQPPINNGADTSEDSNVITAKADRVETSP